MIININSKIFEEINNETIVSDSETSKSYLEEVLKTKEDTVVIVESEVQDVLEALHSVGNISQNTQKETYAKIKKRAYEMARSGEIGDAFNQKYVIKICADSVEFIVTDSVLYIKHNS